MPRRRWLCGLLVVLLLGFTSFVPSCAHIRTPQPAADTSLRVMTFNLDKDAAHYNDAFRAIAAADPDVICFQEASGPWQAELRARLSERYPHAAFNEPTNGYDGISVLSRFPIASQKLLKPASGGWFPSQLLVLEARSGKVQLLNVHLRPPVSSSGNRVVGFLSTTRVRRAEMENLHAQLAPDLPTLIVGDFNEGDSGGAVGFLQHHGFTDALPEFDKKTPSWQGRYMGIALTDRPDHVMYSNGLQCAAARVIAETSSDHDPVVATIGSNAR